MDIRLQHLSYSGLLNLHSCPRRFQLDRLNAEKDSILEDMESSVTFAYGHAVGLGIQLAFENKSEEEIIWQLFLQWEPDLFASNPRQAKSFWSALQAVQSFLSIREHGFLEEWDLVYYEGKPACELSFRIELPNNFVFRGFVDAVLQNRFTGEVRVLEVKTTSATNLNPAQYKNSAQGIGYSVVLDHMFPTLSSYEVLYLVYTTKNFQWNPLPFQKSYLQRAQWIQELILDCEVLAMYEQAGVYPMRGESCYDYYRECQYLQTCTLNTAYLTTPLTEEEEAKYLEKESQYQVRVTVQDLITAQLGKEVIAGEVGEVGEVGESAPKLIGGDMML